MDWSKILLEFVKPTLLVLVPILWYLGTKLKATEVLKDKWIPFVLMGISIIFSLSYVLIIEGLEPMAFWMGIVQGFALAVIQGQFYQYVKQLKKDE